MCNTSLNTVRDLLVLKENISSFLDFRINNPFLKDCHIRRLIDSGNYIIFTFDITKPEQRDVIDKNEVKWCSNLTKSSL